MSQELLATAQEYPVLTLIGPRQSGKTTLVRALFPDHHYVNLENPELRLLSHDDPKSLFTNYPPPVILDEIQNVPELLSWIQVQVDAEPGLKAQFILTGSHQLRLREAITQSLAGRTALLTLLPFSLSELPHLPENRSELLLKGFMPRLHDQNIRPQRFYRDYYQTYVERDVRKLIALENQQAFELFLRLLAGHIGQELNLSSLASQVGISAPQIKRWLGVLEASFLVFRLPPFTRNYGKRLTKSPKIYFTEVGLAVSLLGLESAAQIERDPLFGNLFENLVVAEAFKQRHHAGQEPRLYFFRDHHQKEVDLLFPKGAGHIPIEIKSARTFRPEFTRGLSYFRKLSGIQEEGMLIYDGDQDWDLPEARVRNFRTAFSDPFWSR